MSLIDGVTRYKPKRGSLRSILLSQAMADALRPIGERIAATAREIAPVDTGQYRDEIVVVEDRHPTRVAVHVGSKAPHALVVEARAHVMRRALG